MQQTPEIKICFRGRALRRRENATNKAVFALCQKQEEKVEVEVAVLISRSAQNLFTDSFNNLRSNEGGGFFISFWGGRWLGFPPKGGNSL